MTIMSQQLPSWLNHTLGLSVTCGHSACRNISLVVFCCISLPAIATCLFIDALEFDEYGYYGGCSSFSNGVCTSSIGYCISELTKCLDSSYTNTYNCFSTFRNCMDNYEYNYEERHNHNGDVEKTFFLTNFLLLSPGFFFTFILLIVSSKHCGCCSCCGPESVQGQVLTPIPIIVPNQWTNPTPTSPHSPQTITMENQPNQTQSYPTTQPSHPQGYIPRVQYNAPGGFKTSQGPVSAFS